jgi:hypothetical protein
MTVSRISSASGPAPVPDLADVLHALGHSCPLGCARASDELRAPVWLTRTALPAADHDDPMLVVVDLTASLAPQHRSQLLLRFVDQCARSDGIRVRERRASDLPNTPKPL